MLKIGGRTRTGSLSFPARACVASYVPLVVVLAQLAVLGPVGAQGLFSFVDGEDRYQERRLAGLCLHGRIH